MGAELFHADRQTLGGGGPTNFLNFCEKRLEILKPQNEVPQTAHLALTHNFKTTL